MSAEVVYLRPHVAPQPSVVHDEPDEPMPGALGAGRGFVVAMALTVLGWCAIGALIGAWLRGW